MTMTTTDSGPGAGALPTPAGWYCLGGLEDLPAGEAMPARLAGEELVVWQAASGAVHVSSAFCPHLGAHLGHGGKVEGESLRCPFHGFRFSGEGACVATGYDSDPPRRAELRRIPSIVRHGLIFAWYHPAGEAPGWEPPVTDDSEWTAPQRHQDTLIGHPQEISENSVDIGHFSWVHGFTEVEELAPASAEGPLLAARYAFRRPFGSLFGREVRMRQVIDVSVWGLGYSRVEVQQEETGLQLRLLVLPTPLGDGEVTLRLALLLREPGKTPTVKGPLRFLPRALAEMLIVPPALRTYVEEVHADFDIWQHKVYLQPPALARGDGPIGRYRAWARQFYPRPQGGQGQGTERARGVA